MAEPTLQRGRGPRDWVVYAQQMLNEALSGGMHIDVPENGTFDEEFEGEVKGFQSRVGIEVDGKIGPDTWAALKEAVERKHAATAEEEDEPDAPRQRERLPSQKPEDNVFRERQDEDGNTVRVYDMEEEEFDNLTGRPADWNSVVRDMVEMAHARTGEQIGWVLLAVQQFESASTTKIGQFVNDAERFLENSHVDFPWDKLVDGLNWGLEEVFSVGGFGGWVYGKVKSAFIDNLVGDLEARANPIPGLQAKLEAGVDALTNRVLNEAAGAIDAVRNGDEIRDFIHEQMREYPQVTEDDRWVDEMVTWFGFPRRNTENVTQPILSNLNAQFDVMIRQAQEELLSTT